MEILMNMLKNEKYRFQNIDGLDQHDVEMKKNHLLASLPFEERCYWAPELELVYMPLWKILQHSGKKPSFMFFPTTAMVSLMYVTLDGASSEVALTGNDGAVGMSLFLSESYTPNESLIQSSGKGFRLGASATKSVLKRGGPMLETLLNYSQKMMLQVMQTAVANRYFSIEQRLSRRLLLSLDRATSNDLQITHEMLSNILGVRRESVTEAALKLQKSGAIRYGRGNITILDRIKLEKSCYECYTRMEEVNKYPVLPI